MPKRRKRFHSPKIEYYENLEAFHSHGIDYINKTISFCNVTDSEGDEEGVNPETTERFLKNLHLLDSMDDNKPITVIMNNSGGDSYAALGIYDAIKACKCEVIVKIFGACESAATLIALAADRICMSTNSIFMLHIGSLALKQDHAENTYNWVSFGKKQDRIYEDIYLARLRVKNPYFTREQLKDMLTFDCILTAQQALEYGLIDEVIE